MRWLISFAPLLLVGLIPLSASTTPTIELSKDDSAKAQALHDALTQTQNDYSTIERQMYRGYVKDSSTQGFPGPLYSADFRFLVGAGDPAPILELSQEDTAKLQTAYDSLVKAQQDLELFHQHILETYIAIRGSEKGAVSFGDPAVLVPVERAAFQHYRYTQDYRFILPK
jgi:hypothetical protein